MPTEHTQHVIDQMKKLIERLEKGEAHAGEFVTSATPENIDTVGEFEVYEIGRSCEMRIAYQLHR